MKLQEEGRRSTGGGEEMNRGVGGREEEEGGEKRGEKISI